MVHEKKKTITKYYMAIENNMFSTNIRNIQKNFILKLLNCFFFESN